MMRIVGVVGLGTVGGTLMRALNAATIPTRGYDPYLGVGQPESFSDCSLIFLSVPTPPAPSGELETSAVWKAVRDIEACLVEGAVIAIKSTVPPGTSDALGADFPRFDFASVPEFLVSNRPMETLTRPDRIVVGARTHHAADAIADVMRRVAPGSPIVRLTPTEAELVKLASNAMLAAKVSMANELAMVSERFGVDWSNIQAAVGLDRRIQPDHLTVSADRGFSGGCFPKDLDGMIAAAHSKGYTAPLLEAVASFNRWVRAADSNPDGDDPS